MNIDFSSSAPIRLGSLRLCSMTDTSLNNVTVDGLMAIANTLLGGGSNGYAIGAIATLAANVNSSFLDGTPSSFAAAHLVNGACP